MIAIANMPADKVAHYNRIDIGIFLVFLEVCLQYNGIGFEKELFVHESDDAREEVLVARYHIIAKVSSVQKALEK